MFLAAFNSFISFLFPLVFFASCVLLISFLLTSLIRPFFGAWFCLSNYFLSENHLHQWNTKRNIWPKSAITIITLSTNQIYNKHNASIRTNDQKHSNQKKKPQSSKSFFDTLWNENYFSFWFCAEFGTGASGTDQRRQMFITFKCIQVWNELVLFLYFFFYNVANIKKGTNKFVYSH